LLALLYQATRIAFACDIRTFDSVDLHRRCRAVSLIEIT
jgi:hypothetical protein